MHLFLLILAAGIEDDDEFLQLLAIHVFYSCLVYQFRVEVEAFPGIGLKSLVYLKQIDQIIYLDAPPLFLATFLLRNFEQALLSFGDVINSSMVLLSTKVLYCLRFFKNLVDDVVQIFGRLLIFHFSFFVLYFNNFNY